MPVFASEDYTTYTEVDTGSSVTVASDSLTLSTLTRDEEAYVYYDFGTGYFDDDFEHTTKINFSALSTSAFVFVWGVSNTADNFGQQTADDDDFCGVWVHNSSGTRYIKLRESDGSSQYDDSYSTMSLSTDYYLKIKRDEAVGTHGTLYCYIYSDEAMETLVDTLSLTLHTSKKDYRYVYGLSSWTDNNNSSITCTGTIGELYLGVTYIMFDDVTCSTWSDAISTGDNIAYEDIGLYAVSTEDVAVITLAPYSITLDTAEREEIDLVYKDFGTDFFDGDFEQEVVVELSATSAYNNMIFWGLSNEAEPFSTTYDDSGSLLYVNIQTDSNAANRYIKLTEIDSGSVYTDTISSQISLDTPYYLTITRDESTGIYGTLYCYIYSAATKTAWELIDTLELTLHSSLKDYRYHYVYSTFFNDVNGATGSLITWNYNLDYKIILTENVSETKVERYFTVELSDTVLVFSDIYSDTYSAYPRIFDFQLGDGMTLGGGITWGSYSDIIVSDPPTDDGMIIFSGF